MRRWHVWTVLFTMGMSLSAPQARAAPVSGSPIATCLAAIRPGDTPIRMLAVEPARFDCRSRQTAFGAGDF